MFPSLKRSGKTFLRAKELASFCPVILFIVFGIFMQHCIKYQCMQNGDVLSFEALVVPLFLRSAKKQIYRAIGVKTICLFQTSYGNRTLLPMCYLCAKKTQRDMKVWKKYVEIFHRESLLKRCLPCRSCFYLAQKRMIADIYPFCAKFVIIWWDNEKTR